QRSLDGRFKTMAEILADQGYATAGVCANSAMVTPDFGLDQGFHLFKVHQILVGEPFLRHIIQKFFELSNLLFLARQYLSAEDVNDEALPILSKLVKSERPFFLFVNYMDTHDPIVAPRHFATRFANGYPLLALRQVGRLVHASSNLIRDVSKSE